MIARWNRREVFAGNSMEEFNRVLDALANRGIKYVWDKNRRFGGSYYIYVHKKDIEEARFLSRR